MAFTKIVSPGIDTTGSYTVQDLNAVGVVTASAFSGPLTGNATGLTGTPDIAVANITASGNVSIGGTLTYEDVTNIDSVGIITAQAGVKVPDSQKIFLGTGDDLQIYHNGTNSYLDNAIGSLYIRGANGNHVRIQSPSGEDSVVAAANGSVELYYDNSLKLQTANGGVNIVGNINLNSADNYEIRLGANNDLKLYHDGTDSWIDNTQGDLYLRTTGSGDDIIIRAADDVLIQTQASEGAIIARGDGQVELYHNNVKKLETTSAGLKIHEDTNKVISFSGGIGEIGHVTGLQAINTAASSLVEFGIRATDIRFATGSAERVRIASNGLVGIGTDNPDNYNPNADDLVIFGTGHQGLTIRSGTSHDGSIMFNDTDNANQRGIIRYIHTDDAMAFHTSSGEALRIDSSGCIRVGNTHSQTTSSNTKRIALGAKGSIWGWTSGNINGALTLADNYYWDGANNRAIEADDAAYLSLRSGSLRFGTTDTTPSAGGVTGLTEKFRITSDGNVSVNHDSPNTRLYVRENGVSISSGNAILNSTQRGIRLANSNNNDTSLGLWFTTGDSHHAGISGQRTDSANHWGTDLRFYTHEGATNDLTYTRERLRISCNGLLSNRKGNNAINTGGTILGRYKYTQQNQSQNYEHNILGPDGRNLNNFLTQNVYARIRIQVTGTGTSSCFCEYLYTNNSSLNAATLSHLRGNSGSSSNRPYMVLNGQLPAWKMNHAGTYVLDIEVAMYGGKEGYTYTTEYGNFGANP